jgi:hypothetical protein
MVSRAELLAQALRSYPDFLRALVTRDPFFPLQLRLGKTRRAEDYAGYQRELTDLREAAAVLGFIIEWESVKALRFGSDPRPARAAFHGELEYLRALGKGHEVNAFREDVAAIRMACPALESWLVRNVRRVVAQHGLWPRLLRVVCWFQQNPRCGLYLRQLPIPGIDTKFFETHSAILDELITAAIPADVRTAEIRFSDRHGLRREEPLLRFRFLDPALQIERGFPVADLAVPVSTFRVLPLANVCVIITENLRNFLALPELARTVAVFGGGNALALFADVDWLTHSALFYWGDLDAHGFLMLSRFRRLFPHTVSLMMDGATLAVGYELIGPAAPVDNETLAGLTREEAELFAKLRDGSIGLEQERLPWDFVTHKLVTALSTGAF